MSTTTTIPLFEKWSGATPDKAGLFMLADGVTIPGGWEPKPDEYSSKAMPTPFARAEATRLVLARVEEAPAHELINRFRLLLIGVATGVLQLGPDDLDLEKYDNFGQALRQVDADSRYFCHIRWPETDRSFGLTHRSSLVSPHARRAQGEWDELAVAFRSVEPKALALLAEWRAVLRRAGRWVPALSGCEWQRGVDHVIDTAGASPSEGLDLLREHARLVGPVWLCLPTGRSDEPVRQEPVYLPSYAPDYAARFVRVCQFRPREDPARGGIVFVDAGNREVARIALPGGRANTDAIALGVGLLELHSVPVTPAATFEDWINGKPGMPGLVELLKPLAAPLQKFGRIVDPVRVNACAALYPDPIRILCERGLWPSASAGRTIESRALAETRVRTGGRALDPDLVAREGGEMVQLGSDARTVTLIVLDQLGENPVWDLRALGFVLWSIFVHEAEISGDLGGQIAAIDTLERLLENDPDRPLEPSRRIYETVCIPPPDSIRRRLATMQRFVKAYRTPEQAGLPRLLDRAARSFVAWASGRADVVALGRPSGRFLSYRLSTGEDLHFAVDAVEP